MNNSIARTPFPENEPIRSYAPGSPERASLQQRLRELKNESVEIPAFIGGEKVFTGNTANVVMPHDHRHVLGKVHKCGADEVERAVKAALEARKEWSRMPWTERSAIFLRAAELLAGPWRDTINASTMLGQSKNAFQAEIDAACELIDFFRFNAYYMQELYERQPRSSEGVWNRMQYRPLEGFVLAVAPFNFTSIECNLPSAPAMLGNVVLWKPATTSVYSAYYFYRMMAEAGLPPGVINMVPGNGPDIGNPALDSKHFAGLHFTGSAATFNHLWRRIGENIDRYRTYPRIVGETGGKDFIIAHASADADAVATAIVRGSFEYQGQKCSASSRVYLPQSLWDDIRKKVVSQVAEIKMGGVDDFSNFVNAVIDRKSYKNIVSYIDHARDSDGVEFVCGGKYSDETGWFIEPTLLRVDDPKYRTMCEEIFGPVVTAYVYEDDRFDEMLRILDETSPYALTGAVFANDRAAVNQAADALVDNAGNFYVNDKPTGAVVGQQPFGGARGSGTNDKAGSIYNLTRWVSVRSIKENLNPPTHFSYPFLEDE